MGSDLEVITVTHPGRARRDQKVSTGHHIPEEPLKLARDGALFVVASGLPGSGGGESPGVELLLREYFSGLEGLPPARRLREAVGRVTEPAADGSPTTLTALLLWEGTYFAAQAGDGQVIHVRGSKARIVPAGFASGPVLDGDTFLLLTDGLRAALAKLELCRPFVGSTDLERSAGTVLREAKRCGGRANLALTAVRVARPQAVPRLMAQGLSVPAGVGAGLPPSLRGGLLTSVYPVRNQAALLARLSPRDDSGGWEQV